MDRVIGDFRQDAVNRRYQEIDAECARDSAKCRR